MFITNAYAQAAGGSTGEVSTLMTFAPFILIFVIMYFLIIRPQRNQMKKRQEMLNAIRRGDTVITEGGLIGRVTKVVGDANGEVEIEIAENTRVRVMRAKILTVEVKGEPVSEQKSKPALKAAKGKNKKKQSDNRQESNTDQTEQAASAEDNNSGNDTAKIEKDENKSDSVASQEKTGA
ncbi:MULTISPECIES: preprotein translocase subunit YajC [Bartonella]|uniref:preprotein translocase subunit YajC n=1 Tax=Bartonella TaxID=773 RepID=UPI0018DEC329|nr:MULTISPECIES: preprotein translocase subunit YajC [Bartonella]MBH9994660.1 preprotein translocase subunit YajC [Bartonella sp. P0291]MBH9996995.1 preprotein translocase subunit YajC [Bartonella sp. M0192]MBH9999155.1 preprotein translocase subunit YajC [Bartonella sp. M0191]MBI0007535.1 preprotein translocase subunit YajC [Bartonella sp. M0193]MBI0010446.1 preprotein translocase subunit YajC [Bartonella sp. M0176]